MSDKELKEVLNEECECNCEDCCFDDECCACDESCECENHNKELNYNGTTYTVNFDNCYCDDMEECECCGPKVKTIALVGAGVAVASGILFYTLNKKRK